MSDLDLHPGSGVRRTLLASERTYLAWLRTGLTTLTVGLAVARVVPGVSGVGRVWPYTVVGALFAVYGVVCVAYSERRRRMLDAAVRDARFAEPDVRVTTGLSAAAVVLGVAVLALVVLDG